MLEQNFTYRLCSLNEGLCRYTWYTNVLPKTHHPVTTLTKQKATRTAPY